MRVLALVALVAACGAPQPSAPAPAPISNRGGAAPAHELLASIERTACYGWCPIYKLTVYRDGVVEYDGERFVKLVGKATGHLAPEQLEALDRLFHDKGYAAFSDKYDNEDMTDAPTIRTSYASGGHTKSVEHYRGDSHAPGALGEVEEGIDRIVGVEQWIGTEAERDKLRDQP